MIIKFRNNELERLANGTWDQNYPIWIGKKYRFILHELSKMKTIHEARNYHWRKAEWKEGNMNDQLWIRLNKSRRVMFKIENNTLEVLIVQDLNNHYQ
jgi:plasmid maintenance system killer protein